ncbi:hypothetical protein ABH927_004680 [Planotetraspora sp. GP83]
MDVTLREEVDGRTFALLGLLKQSLRLDRGVRDATRRGGW